MIRTALSHNEKHRLRCERNCLYVDVLVDGTWQLHQFGNTNYYVDSDLLAISSDGMKIAFVDKSDHTLYVCELHDRKNDFVLCVAGQGGQHLFFPSAGPQYEWREIGRLSDFPADSFTAFEWDEGCTIYDDHRLRLALLGVHDAYVAGQPRQRYETAWLPDKVAVNA